MTASDHLGPQFYHASPASLSPGDMLEPGHSPVFSTEPQRHVFVTSDLRNARTWARTSRDATGSAAHVYQVAAPGRYEPDPLPTGPEEYRTTESLPVLRRVASYK